MPNTREKAAKWFADRAASTPMPGAREMFQIAADALQEKPEQEWISVKDRLPQEKGEICKNVILFMDDGLVTVGWLNEDITSAFYLDTRNDFVSRVPMSRCTHWMPLPPAPEDAK